MNALIATLNPWGASFLHWAGAMLWQSSLLAVVILLVDLSLRRWVRASVRHGLWLVLLIKLILPPTFALPTSPAWWWSRRVPEAVRMSVAEESPADPVVAQDDLATPPLSPPVPLAAPAPRPPLTLPAWSLLIAAAGSLGLLAWLGLRYAQVLRLCRLAEGAPELGQSLEEARRLAGIRVQVRVKISPDTLSPAVCGLFRPVILLPQSLVETLSPEQVRAVLVHELTHVRRGDVWVNCAQGLLQIVYWWHPLVWFANARIRRVREEAVDDAVMVALHENAEIYAPTLLAVARFALHRPLASLGLVGILESRSALRQRIERLVNLPVPARAGLSFASALGLVLFSAMAVPMGVAPPPPSPGPPYETLFPEAALSVNWLIAPFSTAPDLSATGLAEVPWPDPRFHGYQSVNLRADFFILDEAPLRAKIPALGNGQAPVAIGPDEVDDLVTHLKQAGARFFDNYEKGIDVPGISGTRQHYHIGGNFQQTGTAEFATTNIDGHSMISGTEIYLSASQPDWTPVDFTVRPWQQDDRIRCELKLGTGEPPQNFQSAELAIPSGGALAWVTTASVKPGKCEVIFLMSWNTNDRLSSATFQHRRIPLDRGFQFFVDDQYVRDRRNPSDSIWRGANDWGSREVGFIYPLLHEAGLNWLPPRQLTTTFYFNSLEVYAPVKDIKVIESMVGKISKSTLDDEERELKQVLVANPTNAWARHCLELIQKSRGTGSSAPGRHRAESVAAGQKTGVSSDATTNLCQLAFSVNTNLFEKELAVADPGPLGVDFMKERARSASKLNASVKNFFKARGVNLDPPKVEFYNDRMGLLFIKATRADLDIVEKIVASLNQYQDAPLDDRPFDTIRRRQSF